MHIAPGLLHYIQFDCTELVSNCQFSLFVEYMNLLRIDSKFDMVDVNNRAIHLANMNIKNNKVDAKAFYSDALSSIDKNYDLIVTNPPIRAGKVVVEKILLDSLKHLNDDGELWFVIRKDQGAKSIINLLKPNYDVNLVEKCKGFYVIKAKNVDKAR